MRLRQSRKRSNNYRGWCDHPPFFEGRVNRLSRNEKELGMLETRPDHKKLSLEIHQDNRNAGWWTNIDTGDLKERNFGEMLALVHSEISECYEGILANSPDTHLTDVRMERVEIADACIRVYDMIGGMLFDGPFYIDQSLDFPIGFMGKKERLVYLHYVLSQALEHYRKQRLFDCKKALLRFLDLCFEYAEDYGFDLLELIERKREYNRKRADHKIENRLLADGKKI